MTKNTDEIRRLLSGPQPGENPAGSLVRLRVTCETGAAEVLQAVREVWATALWQPDPGRLGPDDWRMILPRWFLERFEPEIKPDDAFLRRAFQLQERMSPYGTFTLKKWVHLLEPPARGWAWWTAKVTAPYELEITVVAHAAEAGLEALNWALFCGGARTVEPVR